MNQRGNKSITSAIDAPPFKSESMVSIWRSPLRYPGGKQKAISQIARMLPSGITEYREPMVGGGSVYFHARSNELAEKYWINDKFQELIHFWTTVQDPKTCGELQQQLKELKLKLKTVEKLKAHFHNIRKQNQVIDSFQSALNFFFINRVSFSGTTQAGGFSAAASTMRFTDSSIERLSKMPEALKSTRITSYDFERVITKPGKNVFLFLDPPYLTSTKLYGRKGSLHVFDHKRLSDLLKASEHKFLITYDDCPEIRKLYSWAHIEKWNLQYGMNNCNLENSSKLGKELFISNY